jgi:Methyltransferase domain
VPYLLDNLDPETGGRFGGLEACFDETTFRHLKALGVGAGWRCWEIGAGGGSVTRWMAEQVGGHGSVLATDLNLDWISPDQPAGVELRRHDVTSDEIPSSAYELIHARLVLGHLSQRDELIPRLVSALVPGGWLALEEFSSSFRMRSEPGTEDERTFARVVDAFRELLHRRGGDTTTYPRALPWQLNKRASLRLALKQGSYSRMAARRPRLSGEPTYGRPANSPSNQALFRPKTSRRSLVS